MRINKFIKSITETKVNFFKLILLSIILYGTLLTIFLFDSAKSHLLGFLFTFFVCIIVVFLYSITKRREKQADAAVKSEERLRSVIDNVLAGVLLIDARTGKVVEANSYAMKILGLNRDEIIGKSAGELSFVKSHGSREPLGLDGIIKNSELSYLRSGHHEISLLGSAERLTLGGVEFFIISFVDITHRKRMELTLEKERDKFNTYIDIAGIIIIVLNRHGEVELINRKGFELLGLERSEIIGKNWFDNFLPQDIRKQVKEVLDKLIRGKIREVDYFENYILTADKRKLMVGWHNTVIRDSSGNVIGILSSGEDITYRRQAEQALKDSEERLKILFECSPDACYLSDLKGIFIDGNRMAEELTGYRREELIGKSFFKLGLLAPGQIKKAIKAVADNALGKPTGPEVFNLKRKDGKNILLEIKTYPVKIKGKLLVLGSAHDITRRRKAEENLQKAYEDLKETQRQLIQTEKMATLGRLASGVAHEVKNPLHIIIQGVSFLERELAQEQGKYSEVLTMMKDAIGRADEIIKNLLNYSRRPLLILERANISDVIDSALSLLCKQELFDNIEVIKNYCDDNTLDIDSNQMEQVFINIFLNSVQAMPKGGTITITTCIKELSKEDPNTGQRATDLFSLGQEVFVCEIKDTGSGIPEDNINKVFDPFFTTKPPGQGVGLGLGIVRIIVERHKGIIDIESKEGQCAKVIIILPLENRR
ncbi:MAG: PAS domain S-box protein [Candidatus Omnitrophota bacterium]